MKSPPPTPARLRDEAEARLSGIHRSHAERGNDGYLSTTAFGKVAS